MKKIRLFLLVVFSTSLVIGLFIHGRGKGVDESLFMSEVAPDVAFGGKKGDYYLSQSGVAAFNTYDVSPSIKGYAGPIKVLVALAPDGNILGIRILEHRETPNYVHRMNSPEFLKQFLGKNINDPFEIDKDIDGISRATVSVRALADTVRESSVTIAAGAMGLKVAGSRADIGIFKNIRWIAFVLLFFSAVGAYFIFRAKDKTHLNKARDAVLLLSIFVLGVWLSSPFSVLHVFNLLLLRFSTDALWVAVVGGVIFSVAIAGRFYCGWLCPFGALAEFIGRLPVRKWDVPVSVDDRWRNAKYLLLGLVAAVVLVSGKTGFGNFETYVTLFSRHGTAFTWAVVAVGLIANLRVERFWCRYFCPVGALAGVLSRRDSGYVSRKGCPMANKPMPLISECIRCNSCYLKT